MTPALMGGEGGVEKVGTIMRRSRDTRGKVPRTLSSRLGEHRI